MSHPSASRRQVGTLVPAASIALAAALATTLATALAACGSTAPIATPPGGGPTPSIPTPSAPPTALPTALPTAVPAPTTTPVSAVPGISWDRAQHVQRPDVIVPAPMPSVNPHPGHFEGQGYMAGVARTARGWVAVGYEWPGWHALSWHSPDGLDWTLTDLGEGDGTFMNAVAVRPDSPTEPGLIVAVGRDDDDAAAWSSTDGLAWRRVASPAFSDPEPLRMTAVVATPGGFVAGGSAGPDIGRQDARLWVSPDGASWSAITPPGAADARVTGIAVRGRLIVAVGMRGTEREPAGSIAWTSRDGRTWSRAPDDPSLATGLMAGVTPGGPGLVAVGADADQRRAMVWTSSDGSAWRPISSPTFLNHGLKIRMTAVAAAPDGLIAVGNRLFGTQFGTAVVWTSPDGRTWSVAPDIPVFGQGEMLALAADPSRVVVVGTVGAPDNYVPTVWVSPPGG